MVVSGCGSGCDDGGCGADGDGGGVVTVLVAQVTASVVIGRRGWFWYHVMVGVV